MIRGIPLKTTAARRSANSHPGRSAVQPPTSPGAAKRRARLAGKINKKKIGGKNLIEHILTGNFLNFVNYTLGQLVR